MLGFKSRKAIIWAIIANFITVFSFHYASAYCAQQGTCTLNQGLNSSFVFAEVVVTIVETLIYIAALKRELSITRIIIASILANASSAIIGGYIVNTLLGGFH
jgi:hypothetical protein